MITVILISQAEEKAEQAEAEEKVTFGKQVKTAVRAMWGL